MPADMTKYISRATWPMCSLFISDTTVNPSTFNSEVAKTCNYTDMIQNMVDGPAVHLGVFYSL